MTSLTTILQDHRRSLLEQERHESSLVKPANYTAPEVPFPIEDVDCDCGGTYDEYDRCSDCANGHDDCEVNECFPCMERAIDRAERMAEGDER